MGFLFGGSNKSFDTTTEVDVPEWLRPFLNQGANTASGALNNLLKLAGSDLVAGFSPEQEKAFEMATGVAMGEGGFIPTAQNELLNTAQGRDISSFLPESAVSALTGLAGNNSAQSFLPESAFSALNNTANGDFLYGGDGFDAAVDAAVRAASPHISSAFGGTAGGLSGGLARQAVGDTAVDAFARQFADERRNQIGAANSLAGVTGDERARRLSASGLLSNLGDAERGRQLSAVNQLPQAGLLGANLISEIGDKRQALEQARLSSPFSAQLQLLQAALGGLPIPSLLGESRSGEENGLEFKFGDIF